MRLKMESTVAEVDDVHEVLAPRTSGLPKLVQHLVDLLPRPLVHVLLDGSS